MQQNLFLKLFSQFNNKVFLYRMCFLSIDNAEQSSVQYAIVPDYVVRELLRDFKILNNEPFKFINVTQNSWDMNVLAGIFPLFLSL